MKNTLKVCQRCWEIFNTARDQEEWKEEAKMFSSQSNARKGE